MSLPGESRELPTPTHGKLSLCPSGAPCFQPPGHGEPQHLRQALLESFIHLVQAVGLRHLGWRGFVGH